MKYSDLIDLFKGVATDYVAADPVNNVLDFIYDRVWAMNGSPTINLPAWLVDCSTDFELIGSQHNYKAGKQSFSGKFFFYDTYHQAEQASKNLWTKQSELNELALKVIGEVKNRSFNYTTPFDINFNQGFFAKDVHNAQLIQVYFDWTATVQTECTTLF